jgi:hypothetical protein
MTENAPIKIYRDRICGGGDTLNLINYMAHTWSRMRDMHEAAFIGFYPLLGQYTTWGVLINDTPCCAVHLMRSNPDWFWGDDPRDTAANSALNPWVLMFYGNDNSSCFLRFPDRKAALAWLGDHQGVDFGSEEMMYYNS